jgi:ATP-dependent helicase HrpB
MSRVRLPVDEVLPELVGALRTAGRVVLRAPPGAGKTTRVPPAVLAANQGDSRWIVMLEPRRVAVRAAARRIAQEHGSRLGDTIGYQVRFDRVASHQTRVFVVTPGILLRWLQDDPFLEQIRTIIFDEFHERNLEVDIALGMARLLRSTVRPDLELVVMSATLDVQSVSNYLEGCPIVTSEGRTYPVEVQYQPMRNDMPVSVGIAQTVESILPKLAGDVLAFLPGVREIRQASSELEWVARQQDLLILPLYGELPPEQQDRALQKHDRRKIVLATNVAETSVTVDGVSVVIDSGLARQQEFDASVGMDRLKLVPISRASAEQRAGRAGRLQAGLCIRLWDEFNHRSRSEQTEPEIRRVDLCGPVLQLLAMGETDLERFPWLDAPKPEAIRQALNLLTQLGAYDDSLTALGHAMAKLPVHPRLAKLLLDSERLGVRFRGALAAAILSEREAFERDDRPHRQTDSDVLDQVEALEAYEANGNWDTLVGRLNRQAADGVLRARDQLARLLKPGNSSNSDELLLQAVASAYPDRVTRRRGPSDPRGRMVGGRGVKLSPQCGVTDQELYVCVNVDAGGVESFVRMASIVKRDWLPANCVETRAEVIFDDSKEQIFARKRTYYLDLILDDVAAHFGDEAEATRVLAEAAGRALPKVLPPPDSSATRLRTRLRCLRAWLPDLDLPSWTDEELIQLLPELARGRRSFEQLRNGPWYETLLNSLTWPQRQTLEREAPDTFEVPTGSEIKLDYEEGKPPVLAVRIQELFGMAETPRIAGGRVKVLLHLLAPNYRPQQVTDDLASFWQNGYPIVRKELRGRYPKHSWPEDPATAEPIRGPKRRTE